MKVTIISKNARIGVSFLKQSLSQNYDDGGLVELKIVPSPIVVRGGDNEILIAVISSLSVGFGALITGILNIMVQMKANKIIIKSGKGTQIEVPANYDLRKIQELVEEVKKIDAEDVNIVIE